MLKDKIISYIYFMVISISAIPLFFTGLLVWTATFLFDKRLVAQHRFSSSWALFYLWLMPGVFVHVFGREKIDPEKPYVMVSNHQSMVDILSVHKIKTHFKWVAKIEIFRVPFLGWNLYLNNYISLKRGDAKSIKKMMYDCEKEISKGSSVFMFPEGTRSFSGRLKPFKPGAFILAKKMRVPLLPVAINGSKDILNSNFFSTVLRGRHEISVNILDEIPYETFSGMTVDETISLVRNRIKEKIFSTESDENSS